VNAVVHSPTGGGSILESGRARGSLRTLESTIRSKSCSRREGPATCVTWGEVLDSSELVGRIVYSLVTGLAQELAVRELIGTPALKDFLW